MSAGLGVFIDGEPMPRDDARAFWTRFSAYMEEHKGDLAGFAKQEGFTSVTPAMKDGQAVLLASRSVAQKAYMAVDKGGGGGGGSSGHRGSSHDPAGARPARSNHAKRRK